MSFIISSAQECSFVAICRAIDLRFDTAVFSSMPSVTQFEMRYISPRTDRLSPNAPRKLIPSFETVEISELILRPVYTDLCGCGDDFKILVLPDHPTPLEIRTHSPEPVPYFLYDSREKKSGVDCFTEKEFEKADNYLPRGHELLAKMIVRD